MRKCLIITSYIEGRIGDIVDISDQDYVICADGGLNLALKENIVPSVCIGDFDSLNHKGISFTEDDGTIDLSGEKIPFERHPEKKDSTDTDISIEHGVKQGFSHIMIIGGLGGRFDHSMANIQTLFRWRQRNLSICLADQQNIVFPLIDESITLTPMVNRYISLFSFSEVCKDVSIEGAEYPLQNATLRNNFPLGVSNEFSEDQLTVSVGKGQLLLVMSQK